MIREGIVGLAHTGRSGPLKWQDSKVQTRSTDTFCIGMTPRRPQPWERGRFCKLS